MRWKLALTLAISMLPSAAFARPQETSAHVHKDVVHDRSAKSYSREPQVRRHS